MDYFCSEIGLDGPSGIVTFLEDDEMSKFNNRNITLCQLQCRFYCAPLVADTSSGHRSHRLWLLSDRFAGSAKCEFMQNYTHET